MPIYNRQSITLQTIHWLKVQTLPLYKIIVVGSNEIDRQTANLADVKFVYCENTPLSNKVQCGVDYARRYEPDAILMEGSDTWLTANWCAVGAEYLRDGADLVGRTQGFTCRVNENEELLVVSSRYRVRTDPFGAGRLVSRRALEDLNWKLFPPGFNDGLDGRSYTLLSKNVKNFKLINTYGRNNAFLADIKSTSWNTINPFKLITGSSDAVIVEKLKEAPHEWLNNNFPDSVKKLKEIVPNLVIKE
jgi:hypothetical protein